MNELGLIYGTPTAEGSYTFTIKVSATSTEVLYGSYEVSKVTVLTRTVTVNAAAAE